MFFNRNQLTADTGVKTAAFRVDIVFDADGGDSGSFTVVHRAHDVQCIAVTCITIGNDRDVHGVGDVAFNFQLFAGMIKLASGMHFSEAEMAKPLAQTPSKPARSMRRALRASWAPTTLRAPGLLRAARSLVALCMGLHDAKAWCCCQ